MSGQLPLDPNPNEPPMSVEELLDDLPSTIRAGSGR